MLIDTYFSSNNSKIILKNICFFPLVIPLYLGCCELSIALIRGFYRPYRRYYNGPFLVPCHICLHRVCPYREHSLL